MSGVASPRPLAALLLSSTLCLLGARLDARAPVPAGPGATLDDFFGREEAYGFSGAVLVAQRGQILLERGYGAADRKTGAPVDAQTVFDIGSITKQFTAAAVLRLEMDGRLRTADTLAKYLPRLAARHQIELAAGGGGAGGGSAPDLGVITLHQLLSHTAGLANLYIDQSPTWRDYLQRVFRQPLIAPPGTEYAYSNTGYDLLAEVVEIASGQGYESYLREHLLLPAGLEATGFSLPDWSRRRIARYQDWETRDWKFPVDSPLERPPVLRLSGSGGLLSTVGDLYRWHLALLGDRILSAAAKAKLYQVVKEDYAYGWRVSTTARGGKVVFHNGYDTGLGVCAGFYRFLDEDAVFIVLANTIMNRALSAEYLGSWVQSLLFGGPISLPSPAARLAAGALAGLSGAYRLPDGGVLQLSAMGGRLVLSTEDPEGVLLLTFPDALAGGDGAWGSDGQIADLIAGSAKGDFTPLHGALWPGEDEEAVRRQLSAWWEATQRELGPFLGSRVVYRMWFDYEGAPELQIYALIRCERGARVVRALRDLNGKLELSPFKLPARLELTLGAAVGAADRFAAWNPKLQMGPSLRFERDAGGRAVALDVLGRQARTAARRVSP